MSWNPFEFTDCNTPYKYCGLHQQTVELANIATLFATTTAVNAHDHDDDDIVDLSNDQRI